MTRTPPEPRLAVAVIAGKAARGAVRLLGTGGTALPGLVAERIDPAAASRLARRLDRIALITGTNGKTTTSAMLARILRADGRPVLHNQAGSNLMRGVLGALIEAAGPSGALPAGRTAVLETDEAALPSVARAVLGEGSARPPVLVFTNLMRDQLDRYGEIDAVALRWQRALADVPAGTALAINADDPLLDLLARRPPGPLIRFGIADAPDGALPDEAVDAIWDPESGEDFRYDRRFFAHLGHWSTATGASRAQPAVSAADISEDGDGIAFTLRINDAERQIGLPAHGLYSVYNALAAAAAAHAMGVDDDPIARGLERHEAAFGRQERIELGGRRLSILLGKNPAGMNQALRTLQRPGARHHLLVLLNDGVADGEDVSWIWDTDWESQAPHAESLSVGGRRAADLALRLEYAGLPRAAVPILRDPGAALREAVERVPPGGELVVLPTYTALLRIRSLLARESVAAAWWDANGAAP